MDKKLVAEYLHYKKLITEVVPSGIVSIVADSYSFWDVVETIIPALKDVILTRPVNEVGMSKVVVRPDSSCPVKVLTGWKVADIKKDIRTVGEVTELTLQGYEAYTNEAGDILTLPDVSKDHADGYRKLSTVEVKGLVQSLWETFGGIVNSKNYKVLDSHIGAIYGDSITLERAEQILDRLAKKGFASSNVVFGIGSYTYNYSTRDTIGMAYKATYGEVDGVGLDIYKEPKTDSGKKSAKGLMRVLKNDSGEFYVEQGINKSLLDTGELKIRFKNGELLNETTFEEIRERLNKY